MKKLMPSFFKITTLFYLPLSLWEKSKPSLFSKFENSLKFMSRKKKETEIVSYQQVGLFHFSFLNHISNKTFNCRKRQMRSFTMIYYTNDSHYVGGQKVIRRTHPKRLHLNQNHKKWDRVVSAFLLQLLTQIMSSRVTKLQLTFFLSLNSHFLKV